VAVAGHEHGLQMLVKDSIPYIVSGSGSKISRVKRKRYTVFADAENGFALLEVHKSGKVDTKFYTLQSKDLSAPAFTKALKTVVRDTITKATTIDTLRPLPETVMMAGNPKLKGTGMKRFLIGKNYREEWTEPLKVPVLDLGKEMGGLKPERQGGGKQTLSLRLEDTTGKEWVLRSIEKFPEAAIPPDLRRTVAKDIVEDGISASYPYASLSMPILGKAAHVPVLRRKLVYIPDDPRLDRFRKTFKERLAILEEREPLSIKKTYNTEELVLRLAKDNDNHVDQKAVLRARLVDNFVMDLDRHEDQWRWATHDTGKGKIYYPIPRDHDQAFFVNQGLLPKFAKKPWYIPEIQGFKAKTDNIKTFNRAARNFDRSFLNELSEDESRKEVDTFLSRMTDEVIESSLHQQPQEIHKYHMQKIINTLKKRRRYFMENMMDYYEFLAKIVNIVGTNQRELFTITKNENKTVQVTVNKIDKKGNVSSVIYNRMFEPDVTKELRIYGLEDSDSFVVNGGHSGIKIRIIGGPGNDYFVNNGIPGNILVYDVSFEENHFSGNRLHKIVNSDPQNNSYNRLYYKYSFINPGVSIEYNIDDGVFLGANLELTNQGFRKEPYASRQYIKATKALQTGSYHFRFDADFIKAIGNTDLLIRSDVKAPINVTNFFGIGNNTVFDKSKPGRIKYYRARYDMADVSVLLRKQLQSWMRINFGPAFQFFHLEPDENKGKFVSNTAVNGLDPNTLYNRRAFAGPELRLDINSKNNQVLPTRGAVVDIYGRSLFGLNSYSRNLTQVGLDMGIFMSIAPETKVVLGTRFGVGHNIGHFEFQQAQYLGGTENLRGYRKQRFAGRTMVFNNTELRLKLADFSTYLFPGSIGMLAFHDIGRVWNKGETSTKWHNGYGAGIWVSPIKRFVVTASATFSKEEKGLPLVTFGFRF
jgi:hypothetical protein